MAVLYEIFQGWQNMAVLYFIRSVGEVQCNILYLYIDIDTYFSILGTLLLSQDLLLTTHLTAPFQIKG